MQFLLFQMVFALLAVRRGWLLAPLLLLALPWAAPWYEAVASGLAPALDGGGALLAAQGLSVLGLLYTAWIAPESRYPGLGSSFIRVS